jgi:hypothetical protein
MGKANNTSGLTITRGSIICYLLSIFSFCSSKLSMSLSKVRAISFDVTGTILVHRYPIMDTYAAAAVWAKLPNPPSVSELKPAFKMAYKHHLTASPCFGAEEGLSSRQWYNKDFRDCNKDHSRFHLSLVLLFNFLS